jgi:hypothetical protein
VSKKRTSKSGKPKGGKTPKRRKVIPGVEPTDQPKILRFTVDGKAYEKDVNPDHMPVRDRVELEDYLRMPWVEAVVSGWIASQKAMVYLAYLAMRDQDEDATLEDVLDANELLVEEVEESDRPTGTSSETPGASGAQS